MTSPIGYVGVDVLNNATICNEATGLLQAGVPLEIVSLYRYARPTFYQDASLAELIRTITYVYPLRPFQMLGIVTLAPFRFGKRFWSTLWKAFACPTEGLRQRLRILGHLLPAVWLATHWRARGLGHIHAHWAHTATTVAMHTASLLGIGFSFTGHANDLFVYKVGLRAKILRARFIVCIAAYHRQLYLDQGADPIRLPVVYCGIDLQRFTGRAAAALQPPTIASVGRLVEKKGFHDLIEAAALLRDRGVPFRCVIAGSGPEEMRLRQLIAAKHLDPIVTITGQAILQEDLPGFLSSATVFALPCVRDRDGDMDGLPQVLIEAMLCEVPSLSTWLVGIPDLVRDGETGLLVKPGDVGALAQRLEQILGDKELASRLGKSGAAWAREYFGRAETVRRLQGLFLWAGATPGNSAPPMTVPGTPGSETLYRPGSAETDFLPGHVSSTRQAD